MDYKKFERKKKKNIGFIDKDEIKEEFGEYSDEFIKILKEDAKRAGIDIIEKEKT